MDTAGNKQGVKKGESQNCPDVHMQPVPYRSLLTGLDAGFDSCGKG